MQGLNNLVKMGKGGLSYRLCGYPIKPLIAGPSSLPWCVRHPRLGHLKGEPVRP